MYSELYENEKGEGMEKIMKRVYLVCAVVMCLALAGCGKQEAEDTDHKEQTDTIAETPEIPTEVMEPAELAGYRQIPEELPEPGEKPENPGTRKHFSFTEGDAVYIFTETENLWLYNQSEIAELDTQFLLNINGNKVVLDCLGTDESEEWNAENYNQVYSDDVVTIYQGEKTETSEGTVSTGNIDASTPMYLTLYHLVYQVDLWQNFVNNGTISQATLYTELAQMGTAMEPAQTGETVTSVLDGLRNETVLDDYKLAYRQGVVHTGFIFCSPTSEKANYDDVSIYMSVLIPNWDVYAVIHIEKSPDYIDRLEDTGETFDGHPIMADYTGELKYFILGEDGACIYLEGIPSEAGNSAKSFSAKEAAYIFDLVLTQE